MVISAFPGTGKTYFVENLNNEALDSDSSNFSWISEGVRNPEFPENYIRHIQANIGFVDYILVSSHDSVREALKQSGIKYLLFYPKDDLMVEYLDRYSSRGSEGQFIDLISKNWYKFLRGCKSQDGCIHVPMDSGKYLSDYINN